jgi:hypothetical protein
MTADEIRKMMHLRLGSKWWQRFGLTGRMQAFCLMEIAAQLAELNERLTPFEGSRKAAEKPAVPEMLDVLESLARVIRDVAKTNPAAQWIVNGGPFTEAEKLIRKAKGEAHV